MQHDHHQRRQHVNAAHHRHQHTGHAAEPLAAAHNAQRGQYRQHRAHHRRRCGGREKAIAGKGVHQIIGRHHVEAHHVRENQKHGEQQGQPPAPQHLFNIVGRAAPAAAVSVRHLIDLRQRALDEGRRAAQQRHQPHPEHRPHTAEADGDGYARNVAGTHPGGCGDHQRLERRHAAFLMLFLPQDPEGFSKHPKLHKACPQREIEARRQQQRH